MAQPVSCYTLINTWESNKYKLHLIPDFMPFRHIFCTMFHEVASGNIVHARFDLYSGADFNVPRQSFIFFIIISVSNTVLHLSVSVTEHHNHLHQRFRLQQRVSWLAPVEPGGTINIACSKPSSTWESLNPSSFFFSPPLFFATMTFQF